MMIDLNAKTAVTLAPHLKTAQLKAMLTGDDYIPILPNFELYRMWISHSGTPSQVVTTDVISIKGLPEDAKLLGEFFMRMASELSNNLHNGIFLLKGAVHLLGLATYAQVLHENNFFLNNVATIPISLEYGAWFAVIDPDNHSNNNPISLHDHLLCQPWFLHVKLFLK